MSLASGTELVHYRILAPVGAGGMGEVYKARDLKLGREVAIKILPHEMLADSKRLRRFEQEARAASALNHPNIVTIYEIGEHEGTPYIAMEYVDGVTLRELLAHGPLPIDELLRFASQMADGLAKAHRAGIIHRDLKPENIIISDDGYVKILDFGLAKLAPAGIVEAEASTLARETTPGAILGTVGYMSPEQAKGEPADFRSDQFSFGTIVYEMATGKRAFERETATQTLNAIIEDDPELVTIANPKVTAAAARVIDRCLSKNPQDRYASTWDMAKDIHSEDLTVPSAPSERRLLATVAFVGILTIVLVLIFALFVPDIREWVAGEGDAPLIDSVAVLPLENLSGDPEQEYFADGMTDELISELAQIQSLRVISRTSIMQYKNARKSVPEIGEELDVDVVVEGTVRRAEGRIRITAQLIDTATDRHLWSHSFERELRDVLSLQSEMARAIAEEVRATITPEEAERLARGETTDPVAYEAYLKGRHEFRKGDEEAFARALAYYDEALEGNPDFALAYAGRAETYINLELWAALRPGEGFAEARRAALRAIDLDEDLAEAHTALAIIQFRHDWDFERAEETFRRAIALDPSYADAHAQYTYLLGALGKHSEAVEQANTALKLDPLSNLASWSLAESYQRARQFDLALTTSHDIVRGWPTWWGSRYGRAQMYTMVAKLHEALRDAESSVEASDRNAWTVAQLGSILGLMGRQDDARAVLAELEEKRSRGHAPALALAWVHMGLGEKDRAVAWLDMAYEEREGWLVEVYRWPLWDSLRDHPGFADIFRRMGLPM